MTPFLILDSLAARRGEGLRPELRALLERHAFSQHRPALRSEGVVRKGSSLVSAEVVTSPEWPMAAGNQAVKNSG